MAAFVLTLRMEQPLLRCLLPAAACAALVRSFVRPGYLGATSLSCCSSRKASTKRWLSSYTCHHAQCSHPLSLLAASSAGNDEGPG